MLKGMIAEMRTGEGKTLTATLPASAAALAGIPVHVVTVNDYLAERDAELMMPVYSALGLSVGVVLHDMTPDQRRQAYACDITYCTNKELTFDYLRDRMAIGSSATNLRMKFERLHSGAPRADRLVMRGLHFAIVDEADSVLIDEARTPLIISGETDAENEQKQAEEAMSLVEGLEEDVDYRISRETREIRFTDSGKAKVKDVGRELGGMWLGTVLREEMARHALSAQHLFKRDEHYLVRDDKIQIIDEYTGRIMEDRSWSEGLHQLIEVKEGVETTGRRITLARMTYQRFFRRYKRVGGMSGTVSEVAHEMWSVYRLPIVVVPPNRRSLRTHYPWRIFQSEDAKWQAIADEVSALHAEGRPVLLGTRSVAASDEASRRLEAANIPHQLLNAAQDADEADIVSEAGGIGRVTIATNMAGRGTDIKIAKDALEKGGLHVIVSELHDARRIDRQLEGRCGRQGDPGSVSVFLSLEDVLLDGFRDSIVGRVFAHAAAVGGSFARRRIFRQAQRRAEKRHSRERRDVLKADLKLSDQLAFTGKLE